jgi:hypothetical protein
MDLDDVLGKAKDLAKNVSDEQIDQAAKVVADKVDDKFEGAVKAVAEQAKKLND